MARLLAALLLLGLVSLSTASAQEFDIPLVAISGGDLPFSIRLAPADADNFRRRVNQLPRLDDPPAISSQSYVVTTSHWSATIPLEDDEDVLDVSVQGDYYPQGGFLRVGVKDEDAWVVLNLRQRAILDRYIRLSLQSGPVLGEQPSTMDVLALSAGQEALAVEIAGKALDEGKALELIISLARTNPEPLLEPREPPSLDGSGFWLIVTLIEGRTLRYFYDGSTLTEALGTERYDASSVRDTLDGLAPTTLPRIEHEEPIGSLLWWPVTIGGGLTAIAAAVWLNRRSGQRSAGRRS